VKEKKTCHMGNEWNKVSRIDQTSESKDGRSRKDPGVKTLGELPRKSFPAHIREESSHARLAVRIVLAALT